MAAPFARAVPGTTPALARLEDIPPITIAGAAVLVGILLIFSKVGPRHGGTLFD